MRPARVSSARWRRDVHPTVGRFMSAALPLPANDNGSELSQSFGANLVVSGLALVAALTLIRALFQL